MLIHSSRTATNHMQGFLCFCFISLASRKRKPLFIFFFLLIGISSPLRGDLSALAELKASLEAEAKPAKAAKAAKAEEPAEEKPAKKDAE